MKRKRVLSFLKYNEIFKMPEFVFLTGVFVCGVFAGGFTGLHITINSGKNIDLLAEYVMMNVSNISIDTSKLIFKCLIDAVILPMVLVLLGYFFSGKYLIGIIMAFKGFIIAFSINAVLLFYDTAGFIVSLVFLGIPAVFSIPSMIIIATVSINAYGLSKQINQKSKTYKNRIKLYNKEILFGMLILFISVIIQYVGVRYINLLLL